MLTSPHSRVAAASLDPALKGLTVVTAALVYVQVVFGALVAHAGPLDLHLAGAARSSSVSIFVGPATAVLLAVVHRLAGSLVLGAAVVLAVRASTAVTHAFALGVSGTGR